MKIYFLFLFLLLSFMTTFSLYSSSSFGSLSNNNLLIQTVTQLYNNGHQNHVTIFTDSKSAITTDVNNHLKNNIKQAKSYDFLYEDVQHFTQISTYQIGLKNDESMYKISYRTANDIPKPDYPSDCPPGTYYNVDSSRGKECLPCIPDVDILPQCNNPTNAEVFKQSNEKQSNDSESDNVSLAKKPGDPIPDVGLLTITEEGMPGNQNPSKDGKGGNGDGSNCERGITITSEDIEKSKEEAGCK